MIARTKLVSILGLAIALAGASAFAGDNKDTKAVKAAKVNEAAPTWKAKDLAGKEWSNTDFKDKIVVMEWVNPGCPVCKACHSDGRIPNMIKELKAMPNVVFIGVNSTFDATVDQNKDALKAYGVEYPVLMDTEGTIGHAFGAKTTPHVFVIDTKGVLRYAGGLDNGGQAGKAKEGETLMNYPLNAVKQIIAKETVSPDSAPSYGCKVHYKSAEGGEHADKSKDKGKDKDKGDKH